MTPITDPNVLVGTSTSDDAAVYRVSDELAIVQSLDFFTPNVDEPYWFGAIAAANSLSDVYAMGGKPAFALNVVAFPRNRPDIPLTALGDILRGAADKAAEAGIFIVGGHTVDDSEPKFGLCVTGFVHPNQIWRNVGAKPGDHLILTKPLGTGIVTTALRAQKTRPAHVQAAIQSMATLNARAADAARRVGIHACTDITGFGFLGHLLEMLSESGVGARIKVSAMPLLPGLRDLVAEGHVPGGARRNRTFVEGRLQVDGAVSDDDLVALCDPQTSGGLLFAVDDECCAALIRELQAEGVATIADVGEVIGSDNRQIHLIP